MTVLPRLCADIESAVANPPRRVWRDWVFVAAIVGALIIEASVSRGRPLMWVVVGIGSLSALTVLWRRTWPLQMAIVGFSTVSILMFVAQLVAGKPLEMVSLAFILTLPYAVFRWASSRDMVLLVPVLVLVAVVGSFTDPGPISEVVGGAIVLVIPCLAGLVVRFAALARARVVDDARLGEREQLARELHDSVAHHVSAIVIQAQAAQAVANTGSDASAQALARIERTAADALAEMRTLVGTLRSPAALTPQGQLGSIETLTEAIPDEVNVSVSVDASNRVPGTVQAAAYRIVQEAITNALRHARHLARVEIAVRVIHGHDAFDDPGDSTRLVEVVVRNDGVTSKPRGQNGYGLAGMTERVRHIGGSLTVGPGEHRCWEVHALLPFESPT